MRRHAAVLVAVTSFLTVLLPALAGPAPVAQATTHTAATDWAFVQHELFDIPLAQFVQHRFTGDRCSPASARPWPPVA